MIQSFLNCADHLHNFKYELFALLHIFISSCNHLSVLFFHSFRCKYLYLTIETKSPTKKVGLADTSVCTLKKVISYARVITFSPKRSTIVFIRLLSHRKSTRTFSPENIKNTSFVKFSISKLPGIGIMSLSSISCLETMRSTLKLITLLFFWLQSFA